MTDVSIIFSPARSVLNTPQPHLLVRPSFEICLYPPFSSFGIFVAEAISQSELNTSGFSSQEAIQTNKILSLKKPVA
jgi:hypothetical protein